MRISKQARLAAMSVCLALTLTACGSSGKGFTSRALPVLPEDAVTCFDELTPAPREGPMNNAEVVRLIGSLRASEVRQSLCGKRLVTFYDSLK